MSICQLGMHKNVQDHTNANVCKQTYDASCIDAVNAICWRSDHIEARFCCLSRAYAPKALLNQGLDAAAFDRAAAQPTGPEAAICKKQVGHGDGAVTFCWW